MKKLASAVCWEGEKVKGSRFIAHLIPVSVRSDVSQHLSLLWDKHPKATHICFAWRLFDGNSLCSDDGEPKGSAGLPILRHLDGAQLVDVLAAVVRFYGGTKLGVGGLIRAYGGAVSQALRLAKIEEYVLRRMISIQLNYSDYKLLTCVCVRHQVQILNVDFEDNVRFKGLVPLHRVEKFLSELKSAVCGRITYVLEE